MKYDKEVGIFKSNLSMEGQDQTVTIQVAGLGKVKFPAKHLNDLSVLAGALRDFYLGNLNH